MVERSEALFGKNFHRKYFRDRLLANANVASLYRSLEVRLPQSAAAELASMYIARGLVPSNSADFAAFMLQLRSEMDEHAEDMYVELLAQDAQLKECPFCYQMTLNLVAGLDLDTSKKARLLGKAFEQRFAVDDKGNVSASSASMTNALMLMKAAGVTPEEALPYVEKGFEYNRGDPRSLREFVARVRVYYPALIH